jgi:lysophospholipase L1-like esterase
MSIRLAMLGDSIAAGQGAARRADTPGFRIAHRLRDRGLAVTTRVYATTGARSSSLAEQVDAAASWRPHVAVVIIGANDLIHHTTATGAARDLSTAVRRLRDAGSSVVVAPAPDLSALPDTPLGLMPVLHAASMVLRDAQVVAARLAGAHVADRDHGSAVMFAADRSLFCADRFHPSSAGYAVITETLIPAVSEALEVRTDRIGEKWRTPGRTERADA